MSRIKDIAGSALYLYQRVFWYVGVAKNEALKPLGFWNETILILTFLTVSGTKLTLPVILIGYVGIMAAAAIVGKVLTVLGIPRYVNRINNKQNDEFMTIVNKITELERIVKQK